MVQQHWLATCTSIGVWWFNNIGLPRVLQLVSDGSTKLVCDVSFSWCLMVQQHWLATCASIGVWWFNNIGLPHVLQLVSDGSALCGTQVRDTYGAGSCR
jgi:hypothetical protein